ncbi:MAG: hypothetical protein Q8O56_07225 [Solirubrobacteraceae bacterium]|nr:hypothetical protein [Solirubrobacteraceae bacterium]
MAEAGACGDRHHAAAQGDRTPGQRGALVIGDSTTILATPLLGRRGLETDAKGCRQFAEGVAIVAARKRAGTLPHLVVVALGANGSVSAPAARRLLRIVGRNRVLALVTPSNSATSRATMRAIARRHPDRVLLIDWQRHSAGRGVFAGDGLHVTGSGAAVYADFIARRAAPVVKPPSRALRLPSHSTTTKSCGTVRRFGRRLAAHVISGRDRIACARARQLAGRPPLRGIPGWSWWDWTPLPGPWVEVYRRADRKVVVATTTTVARPR